jgi:hypothetical protein
MKYAIISNGLVNNVVIAESKEILEEFYPSTLVVEVPTTETLTTEEHHIYLPHIGLGYSEETGFDQPNLVEAE